jgi:hypothetical protein
MPGIGSRPRSSATAFGYISVSRSVCAWWRSCWPRSALPAETDFLRDPDGHGWHLDRSRFDEWLRHTAVSRGAVLSMSTRLLAIERGDENWHVRIATPQGEQGVAVAFVIDAGGRAAPLARRIGARRRASDRLVCGWVHGSAFLIGRGAGLTAVEAVEGAALERDTVPAAPRLGRRQWLLFHQMLHGVDIQLPTSRFSKSIGHKHVLESDLRTKKGATILRSTF